MFKIQDNDTVNRTMLMNRRNSKNFLLLILLPMVLTANDVIKEIRQITTHPDIDFAPAISQDGKWMAFTSSRSGNLDIWIKKIPGGKAIQITTHQAEDSHPVWSPNGDRLAFISKRRDAWGDIWTVDVRLAGEIGAKNRPIQLTSYLGMDRHPSFSPDGKKIAFVSDRSSQSNIWIFDSETNEEEQITFYGGSQPSWSPKGRWILFTSFQYNPIGDVYVIDIHIKGKVYPVIRSDYMEGYPAWSPQGDGFVFIRHDWDTNHDGQISPEDNSSLWQTWWEPGYESDSIPLEATGREIQISSGYYRDQHPFWGHFQDHV